MMAYAHGVVAGDIVTCRFVKQACQRHLDDLERSIDPVYPYRFDEGKAHRFCWLAEKFPHVSGEWAKRVHGQDNRIKLEPWQSFIFCNLFGWVVKSTGYRRFVKSYIEVNRKNAKSTKAAILGNYMFACDGETDAQVFAGATKEKQAMEVFRPARLMAMRSHGFIRAFGIEVNKKSLTRPDGSRFEPLVRNPGDGSSPSCAIVDEYHEHDTSILYDTMESGMGARRQPLLFVITTAGFNVGGPCYMLRDDIIKVLAGTVRDDRQFGIIFTVDSTEEWKTDIGIAKANPNVGVSVSWEYLRGRQQDALEFAHKRNAILTKHFGVWTNQAADWMDMEKWRACADRKLSIADFRGKPCWMGNDLAARIDLASRILIFKESRLDTIAVTEIVDNVEIPTGATEQVYQDHYTIFGYHYAPKATIYDNEHRAYEQWVADGALIACEGVEVRLSQIQRDIETDAELYDMKAIAFDPWGAQQMQQDLAGKFGEDVVISIPQTPQYFSDPLKELRSAIYAGRVHHNGDPVLTWAVSNALISESTLNETVMLRRGPNDKLKIDPVAAMITGMNRAYSAPVAAKSVYSTRGIRTL